MRITLVLLLTTQFTFILFAARFDSALTKCVALISGNPTTAIRGYYRPDWIFEPISVANGYLIENRMSDIRYFDTINNLVGESNCSLSIPNREILYPSYADNDTWWHFTRIYTTFPILGLRKWWQLVKPDDAVIAAVEDDDDYACVVRSGAQVILRKMIRKHLNEVRLSLYDRPPIKEYEDVSISCRDYRIQWHGLPYDPLCSDGVIMKIVGESVVICLGLD